MIWVIRERDVLTIFRYTAKSEKFLPWQRQAVLHFASHFWFHTKFPHGSPFLVIATLSHNWIFLLIAPVYLIIAILFLPISLNCDFTSHKYRLYFSQKGIKFIFNFLITTFILRQKSPTSNLTGPKFLKINQTDSVWRSIM